MRGDAQSVGVVVLLVGRSGCGRGDMSSRHVRH